MSDDCLFCGIVAGTIPSVKVAETDTTYAFMDINPGTEGHLLVIPKRHSKDLLEISADDLSAVALESQRIAGAVIDELGADGINLLNCCGADAWQTVFHFHLHLVPRYANSPKDQLVLPWQPGQGGDMDRATEIAQQLGSVLA